MKKSDVKNILAIVTVLTVALFFAPSWGYADVNDLGTASAQESTVGVKDDLEKPKDPNKMETPNLPLFPNAERSPSSAPAADQEDHCNNVFDLCMKKMRGATGGSICGRVKAECLKRVNK